MIGFPFDSHVTYDAEGLPEYDRAISSAPYRALLHKLFNDGVMPNPSTNMQVIAGEGMSLIVQSGFAMVQGCMKLAESDENVIINPNSDSSRDRIDTVVLRLNTNDDVRSLEYAVIEGEMSTNPVAPQLVRSGSIYDIGLADVLVRHQASVISDSAITDTRYNTERCGILSSISEFDTTTLYNQIQSDLSYFRTNYEEDLSTWTENEKSEFIAWFETIKDILDESVAGHLQNEIDALNQKINNIKLVHFIINYDPTLAGATITVSNGVETYTDTANPLGVTEVSAMSLGVWEISEDMQGTSTEITTEFYGKYNTSIGGDIFINVAYDNEFSGKIISCTNGVKTLSKIANGNVQFCVNDEGTWTISSEVDGITYTNEILVSHNNTYDVVLNVGAKATIYGATNETITSSSGDIYYTDSNGECINAIIPFGEYTFSCSVSGKTYTHTISKETTKVYCRPQKFIYWYGVSAYAWTDLLNPEDSGASGTAPTYNFELATNSLHTNLGGTSNKSAYRMTLDKIDFANINTISFKLSTNRDNSITGTFDVSANKGSYYFVAKYYNGGSNDRWLTAYISNTVTGYGRSNQGMVNNNRVYYQSGGYASDVNVYEITYS